MKVAKYWARESETAEDKSDSASAIEPAQAILRLHDEHVLDSEVKALA